MKLKFNDPKSIAIRDQGRINAIKSDLLCPHCGHSHPTSMEMWHESIEWVCRSSECMWIFRTDLEGRVIDV